MDALLVLEEVADVALGNAAELLVGLEHCEQFVEVEVDGLEGLVGQDLVDAVVDNAAREDLARVAGCSSGRLVLLVSQVVQEAREVQQSPDQAAVFDCLPPEEVLELR